MSPATAELQADHPFPLCHRNNGSVWFSSCSDVHKSHQEKFMVDRCFRTWRVSPSFLSYTRSGRGSAVTKSDPVLTSPCVAKETEELRKREEVRQQGVTTEREERSLPFYATVCLAASVLGLCCMSFRHRTPGVNQTRLVFSKQLKPMRHNTSFGGRFETRRGLSVAHKQQLVGRMETSECKNTGISWIT